MKKIVIVLFVVMSSSIAVAQNEFVTTKNNMEYKLVPMANQPNATTPTNGNKAAFSVVQRMNDSLVFNSYEAGHQVMLIDSVEMPFDIRTVLKEMKVGDSALVRMDAYKILLEEKTKASADPNFNEAQFLKNVPAFFQQQGNYIYIGVKLLDCFTGDTLNANFKTDAARETSFTQVQMAKQMTYQEKMQKEMTAKSAALAANAKANGKKFMAANKTKPGVKTTVSGLQYKVLKLGKGTKPTKNDKVSCHYAGTTLAGIEFDNSYRRGAPIEFAVTGVIAGWTEVLQLMPEGSKYQVWIPSDIGYGDTGTGGDIGPGETLVFDIELLKVIKGAPVKPTITKPVIKKPTKAPVKKPIKKG